MRPAAALALLLLCASAQAAEYGATPPPETIAITGAIHNPDAVTREEIMKLPPVDVTVTQQTDNGPLTGTFRGALLWTIVQNAAPSDGPEKNAYVRHTILVTGADGYAASLSEGELDPRLEGKQVIVAYMKDGAEFEGLRLVVPGDAHGARGVHDISIIEVK
jgi:hypothetical protein